jgi:hypothetical protein
MKTVEQLRKDGFKVKVLHSRKYYSHILPDLSSDYDLKIDPRGGHTKVVLTDPTGRTVESIAKCSTQDNYSKKIGRDIALGRALKEINL